MAGVQEETAEGPTFRDYLPDLTTPRFQRLAECDARAHAAELVEHQRPPWLYALYRHWQALLAEPFRGVTTDGHVRPELFGLRDEGVPVESIVAAAERLLGRLDAEQRRRTLLHVDSPEWRTWSNPEFLLSDKGLRLDELASPETRDAVLAVLEAALSPEGYAKARAAMRVNGFLGTLVGAPRVLNEFSYNFCLFGTPDAARPWGFSFYGHHLCLSVFLVGPQIVVSPWFTGAEPNLIDAGPHRGTRILHEEERLGLALMRSLDAAQQATARTYARLRDPAMPPGRWNHDDQRHLLGAYRDNRVVPYEGVVVGTLAPAQQQLVEDLLAQYLLYLPARARALKLADCRAFFDETYFSWIGGDARPDEAFYFRLQSPVVVVEFDHHSGVFLANEEPKRFHVHTLLRTPNAGDYGMALRALRRDTEVEQNFVWQG